MSGMDTGGGRLAWSLIRGENLEKRKLPPGTLKRIVQFAAPHKKMLAVFTVIIIVDALLGVANPLIYKDIINRGILPKRTGVVVELATLVGTLAVADAFLSLGQRYIAAKVGEGLTYDTRTRVFAHVQRMPLAFFTRTQTGALISRLNNDVYGAQQAFTNTLSSIVSNLLTVILTIAAMAFLSWPITLVALALLPIFLLPARRIGRKLAQLTRERYNLNASMNNTMTERFNVSGALLVKLFGCPQTELDQFGDEAGRVRDIGVRTAIYARVFFLALVLTSSLATALVYGWGGVLAIHGEFDVGTVVALTALLNRLYGPLTALSNMNVDIMVALVSFDRIFEVLDLTPMLDEKPDARAIPRGSVDIEFDHVDFSYPTADEVSLASLEAVVNLDQAPSRRVLHNVSFRVEPGQLVALVGPSGSGKTTISSLVPRLYDVRAGTIRIGGLDVRDARFESLRSSIGVVSQDTHLFHQTIRENLLFARRTATDAELRTAIEAAQLSAVIDSLPDGLETVVGDRGYRLSGGEKQRLAIARLLLKAPDVVVLDEATAHLDSESEAAIQRALDQALAGRTSLVIAHRLSTVRHADHILVVVNGRIAEAGRHEELLGARGVYAELYRTQFAGQNEPPIR